VTRILVVEDNRQNIYLLESILRGNGYDVTVAENGKEALDLARKDPPDLAISDILMPVTDGFTLCRQWKADERLRTIPFIFYTATYTDPRDERFALSLGAERFVIKPQKPEVLAGIVREVLEEARIMDAGVSGRSADEEVEVLQEYNEVLFRKLEKKVRQLEDEVAEHRQAEEKVRLANHKLALMTEVAYQDIQNKVTALRGLAELSRHPADEQVRISFIDKEMAILETIHSLIHKTKEYQQMGVNASRWIPLDETIRVQYAQMSGRDRIALDCDLRGLEIFADPLIERVFYNLLHNAIHHGRTVSRISFTCREMADSLVVVCRDNGVGIDPAQKDLLFERIVGGPGKFGLFFVREFLNLSKMSIRETGMAGKGAQFEITIPCGLYRFREP
jgi:CheY-like chemotaxis protein